MTPITFPPTKRLSDEDKETLKKYCSNIIYFASNTLRTHKELLQILHFTHEVEVDESNYAISFHLQRDFIDWYDYPCFDTVENGKLMITNVTETKNLGYFQVTMIKADCSTELCQQIINSITELNRVVKKTMKSKSYFKNLVNATRQVLESLTLDRYCVTPTTLHLYFEGVLTKLCFRGRMEAGKYYSPNSLELSIVNSEDESTIIYQMSRIDELTPKLRYIHVVGLTKKNGVVSSKITRTDICMTSIEESTLQQELLEFELAGEEPWGVFEHLLCKDYDVFG